MLIDAETGAVVHTGSPEHGKVLAIAKCPFDPATAPWPYNGGPPPESTTEAPGGDGGYSGEPPTPTDCDRVGEAIAVHNWRSSAFIGRDANTGHVCKDIRIVQPEDLVAFQRFLDRVELCEYKDAKC
ncbi:MAG: hypothetical protein E6I38_05460 [Chloroflexi bacterium]|nr:MAG: hypothetical protein E6I38_05460 [Chloroflexota bacterium]